MPKSGAVQSYWQTWTGKLCELQALGKVVLQKDNPIEMTLDSRGLYTDPIDYRISSDYSPEG